MLLWLILLFSVGGSGFLPRSGLSLSDPSVAEDASDRAYLARILTLIGQAEKSIDISMFAVNLRPVPGDPGYRLFEGLFAARQRGISVRLWLNSREASVGSSRIFMRRDLQEDLQRKGIQIFYVEPARRLHDKLMVVDRKIVVEGSMNWTREALLRNFESASIIHSAELAEKKIARLESFPLLQKKTQLGGAPFEESFPFPVDLLRDPKAFPASLEKQEARTLALYLLLLERYWREHSPVWVLQLEEWGEKLPFKRRWVGPSLRFEIKRTLDFLKLHYGLIDWEKVDARQVRITLKPVRDSEQVFIPVRFIEAGYQKTLSPRGLYAYLIARHKAQLSGNVPFWLGPIRETAEEFHLSPVTLIRGLWELKRSNLIEIFPSEKEKVGGRWEREFTNRYLFNPIRTSGEGEERFKALEGLYGEPLVEKARRLADSIDEPEDTQVVEELARFLKHYPAEEVEEATRIVAHFNRNNALRTPAYIRGILEARQVPKNS